MLTAATCAVPPPAGRVLADLLPDLKRFLLRKPSQVLAHLRDLGNRTYVMQMWCEVFHDTPCSAGYSTFDLEVMFVQRVHQELFPVDLFTMDGYAGCCETETPLSYGIPIDSLGVAWEIEEFDYFQNALQALLAFIGAPLVESALGVDWLDTEAFLDSAEQWLAKRGITALWGLPDGPDGLESLTRLRQALALLPAPLNGLSVALDVTLRNTGNAFLDTVNDGWRGEYDDYDALYWDTHTVQELATQYAAARPRIQQLSAYYHWYNNTPDAEAQVVEVLTRLVAGRWSLQDGEIVYHDQENQA